MCKWVGMYVRTCVHEYVCMYVHVYMSVYVSLQDCTAMSPTLLVCQLPTLDLQPGVQLDYALRLDGANLRGLSAVEPLTVLEDPSFENVGDYEYIINSGSSIFLMVSLFCNFHLMYNQPVHMYIHTDGCITVLNM